MKILWFGWFTDINGDNNWLIFACEDDYAKATDEFFKAYAEDFGDETYPTLPKDNLIDVYPFKEVGGYNIKLEAKND